MRIACVVGVLALVMASVASAQRPANFSEAKTLEPAAAYVAKKPVKVWCATSDQAWHNFMVSTYGSDDGANGSSVPGSSELKLSNLVCSTLNRARQLPLSPDITTAASVEVLTHESIHLRGEKDEGITDCNAMHEMAGVASRFYHFRYARLRALMAFAWKWHATVPADLRSVC
jgi:hypothetical protein